MVIALLWVTMNSLAGYVPDYLAIGLTWMLVMIMIIGAADFLGVGPNRNSIWGWVSFGLFLAGGHCWGFWGGVNPHNWSDYPSHPYWIAAGLQIVSGLVYGTYYLLKKKRLSS
jgi:hypothetical protein